MAERLWRERKERIRKEKIAAAMSPLAYRVATLFIDECNIELEDKSDSDLLEMVKEYGSNIALDIGAEQAGKDTLKFINSINHDKHANRIAVNISDMLVRDDFANQVVSLVKENQYLRPAHRREIHAS